MFKVNNKYTRTTPGVFIVNFEHISQLVLVFLLLTLNRQILAGLPCYCDINSFYLPPSTGCTKITSYEVKRKNLTPKPKKFLMEVFFCNTFNLEDDYFVHNSVVSFLLHQNAKYDPIKYPPK